MNIEELIIDYHLIVVNCISFSFFLSNALLDHRFSFEMDLKKPYYLFKGKYLILGFNPISSMLFIGKYANKVVFFAMAPNEFLQVYMLWSLLGYSFALLPILMHYYY